MARQMVTLPTTSRDPERSRSRVTPTCLKPNISKTAGECYLATIANYNCEGSMVGSINQETPK